MAQGEGTSGGPDEPHWNQPGGPSLVITHPAISGRERELRRLTDAVRRMAAAVVTTTAPADRTADLAARLDAVADRLAAHVPPEPIPRFAESGGPGDFHVGSPYDVVHGIYNPLAVPLRMRAETIGGGSVAVAEAVFDTPYEGPPGLVHGAVIAGCFDMVLAGANRLAGVGGPTVRLHVRYRRPTRLHTACRFEGRFAGAADGRLVARGRLLQGEEVTVEAEGEFVELDRAAIDDLARRSR